MNFLKEFKRTQLDLDKVFVYFKELLESLERNFQKGKNLFFFSKFFLENSKKFPSFLSNEIFPNEIFNFKKKINSKEGNSLRLGKVLINDFLSESLKNTKREIHKSKEINSGVRFSVISFQNIETLNVKFLKQTKLLEAFLKKGRHQGVKDIKFFLFLNFFFILLGIYLIRFIGKYPNL